MVDPLSAISVGVGLVSSIFDRGKQKKIDKANAKAAAQADYENKMQAANVNRMNKKATDNANKRNARIQTRTNQVNRQLVAKTNASNAKNVRETNAANAAMQLAADQRSEASSAAARAHDIEAAALNRQQGLDDIKYSAVRLREAAKLGGFNPLTYLDATGGVGPVAGSGVGGRALQYQASSSIAAQAVAPQVSAGSPSQAYLRGVTQTQAAYSAPLRSTAGIAAGIQDALALPGQAAQAARDQATETLKNDVLKLEAERLRTGIAQVQNGPTRTIGPPKLGGSGKDMSKPPMETKNLYVRWWDEKAGRYITDINPEATESGPGELLSGGARLAAGDFYQNGLPAISDWFKNLSPGAIIPAIKPVQRAPIRTRVHPKVTAPITSPSTAGGRYKRKP